MRVLIDTNVLISTLLSRSQSYSSVDRLMIAAIRGDFVLLVSEEVLDEFRRARASKPFLRERILQEEMDEFIALVRGVAQVISRQSEFPPAILRDPRDDFLLVAAAIADADYLVTGDRDLLDIGEHLTQPRICSAAEFLELLSADER